jgi:hypothetical protein
VARSNERTAPAEQPVSEEYPAERLSGVRPHMPLSAVPRLAITSDGLPLLKLNARAAYLLSLVDGHWTIEMILDICGPELERDEALDMLAHFVQLGAIELRDK